jgi:HAD superfamily hydrolase (TIGR01509 family)
MMHKRPKASILDVDGTLYDHSGLKRRLIRSIFFHTLLRPHTWTKVWKESKAVACFRSIRESDDILEQPNIAGRQFEVPARQLGMGPEELRAIIEHYMFTLPCKFLGEFRRPSLPEFLDALKLLEIKTAVFSDYPAEEKLAALGLEVDLVVDGTMPEVDALKPKPDGLLVTCEMLGLDPEECVFIGDRDDKDGECARRAGMPYMLIGNGTTASSQDGVWFTNFEELLTRYGLVHVH